MMGSILHLFGALDICPGNYDAAGKKNLWIRSLETCSPSVESSSFLCRPACIF